ncbi:MAG: PEFG-CTERM sorting domain-containing protein [Nitrososphaera sp.]
MVIGTYLVPEFGSATAIVLGVGIVAIVALGVRTRFHVSLNGK